MMNYEQAIKYLNSINKFGINLGLDRIEKLLDHMNRPERCFKIIHVTGTNGKGSTAAMLASILQAAGIKTALYTSPHLVEYTERMKINNKQISPEEFAATIENIADIVKVMMANGGEHPTEFEILTAAAFKYFATSGVEYAVIEVGLGGLLDSTNVIAPELSVITNVTLEHTDYCGKTIAEIAVHKAGIIKQRTPVVTAAQGDALTVIRNTAICKEAPLYVLGKDFNCEGKGRNGYKQNMSFTADQYGDLGTFVLNLLGRHQLENCAVAIMSALIMSHSESRITIKAIRTGLDYINWPGRFELVDGHPIIVIDGAHNPDGARVLRDTLDDIFPQRDITFLIGVLADKDTKGIAKRLVRNQDNAVVVRPVSKRAANPMDLAGILAAKKVRLADSVKEGFANACIMAGRDGVVCVTGSLYLIGPARAAIYQANHNK